MDVCKVTTKGVDLKRLVEEFTSWQEVTQCACLSNIFPQQILKK